MMYMLMILKMVGMEALVRGKWGSYSNLSITEASKAKLMLTMTLGNSPAGIRRCVMMVYLSK